MSKVVLGFVGVFWTSDIEHIFAKSSIFILRVGKKYHCLRILLASVLPPELLSHLLECIYPKAFSWFFFSLTHQRLSEVVDLQKSSPPYYKVLSCPDLESSWIFCHPLNFFDMKIFFEEVNVVVHIIMFCLKEFHFFCAWLNKLYDWMVHESTHLGKQIYELVLFSWDLFHWLYSSRPIRFSFRYFALTHLWPHSVYWSALQQVVYE